MELRLNQHDVRDTAGVVGVGQRHATGPDEPSGGLWGDVEVPQAFDQELQGDMDALPPALCGRFEVT